MEYAHRPLGELNLEDFGEVKADYIECHKCVHCGRFYQEAENIGQLQCRLHPGIRVYDAETDSDRYTCCDFRPRFGPGGSLQESVEAKGCLPCDHFHGDLCEDDEAERHDDLFELALSVVPTGLFMYGVEPPLPQCLLYRLYSQAQATEKERKRLISFRMPFNDQMTQALVVREALCQVSDAARDSPALLRQLGEAKEARLARLDSFRELEAKWPSTYDDGTEPEKKLSRKKRKADFILPFVIVKRILPEVGYELKK